MADEFKSLLGETLVGKDGSTVSTSEICGEGKTVGIYFSAHWCPPCRGFTPKLADFYNRQRADKNLEVVFVSSDKTEADFKEYYQEMPWLALPFADRNKKETLSCKYKVQGIPTLVLLDGKDAKVITKDGRGSVLEDPEGENFPWRPKSIIELFKEITLVNNKNEWKSWEDLSGKVIGLYFSAHWCPPCRSFTPKLIETYSKLVAKGKPFEIVFVSSDRTEESYLEYFGGMPWLALPFKSEKGQYLSKHFGVQGIPTLILLDENRKVICTNGRGFVMGDPEGEDFPWRQKPLSLLCEMTVGMVNEAPCLIYFTDGKESSIRHAEEITKPIAEKCFKDAECKGEDPPLYFFCTKDDDVANSLREFASIEDEDEGEDASILVILDIPSQKIYFCDAGDLTKDVVSEFVMKFQNGTLKARKLH